MLPRVRSINPASQTTVPSAQESATPKPKPNYQNKCLIDRQTNLHLIILYKAQQKGADK